MENNDKEIKYKFDDDRIVYLDLNENSKDYDSYVATCPYCREGNYSNMSWVGFMMACPICGSVNDIK